MGGPCQSSDQRASWLRHAVRGGVRCSAAFPAVYLARFKGFSRDQTESDLRCFLVWCAEQSLDPLAARRSHLELYIRWMQEIRRFQPSTVSRRISVAAGFYRTCVTDGVPEQSPAEHIRRPSVPAESPTSAKSTATECCACAAKAPKSSWSRCRQPSAGPSTRQ